MDEHVHLHAANAFLVDPEAYFERMPKCHRGKTREEIGVFGLVPISRELVWGADHERVAFNRQSFSGLKPGAIRLFREHLACALAQAIPEFGGRKRHQRGRRAEERRGAKLSLRMWTSQLRDLLFRYVSADK